MASQPLRCKCGSIYFIESVQVGGWWKRHIDGHGTILETNTDGMTMGRNPKTVKCSRCGRTNPNPRLAVTG